MKNFLLTCLSIALLGGVSFADDAEDSLRDAETAAHAATAESAAKLDRPIVEAEGFSVQSVSGRENVQAALLALQGREKDGGGIRLVVVYEPFTMARNAAILEASRAREKGWSVNTFTGVLSQVFLNKAGELCFRMYVLERGTTTGEPAVRTFNTVRGSVKQLIVLAPANSNG